MLYVALQRLGLDAHAYLDDDERARYASKALSVLWLGIELAASDDRALARPRFERTRELPVLTQLRPLARGSSEDARQQLAALNSSGLLDVAPELWLRASPRAART